MINAECDTLFITGLLFTQSHSLSVPKNLALSFNFHGGSTKRWQGQTNNSRDVHGVYVKPCCTTWQLCSRRLWGVFTNWNRQKSRCIHNQRVEMEIPPPPPRRREPKAALMTIQQRIFLLHRQCRCKRAGIELSTSRAQH